VRQAIESGDPRYRDDRRRLPPDAMIEFPWMAIRLECKVQTSRMGSNRSARHPDLPEFTARAAPTDDRTKRGRLATPTKPSGR
jgi:hypothetical protein